MTSRQTTADKDINSFYISYGILMNGIDDDGDIWRGCIVTGVGESTENDLDIHADGEGVAGVVVDFNDALALDLDTANSTAGENLQYLLRGSGGLCYTFHDAATADAIVIGANATASTSVAGYTDLGTDIVVDHLGIFEETQTAVTTTYNLVKVLI